MLYVMDPAIITIIISFIISFNCCTMALKKGAQWP